MHSEASRSEVRSRERQADVDAVLSEQFRTTASEAGQEDTTARAEKYGYNSVGACKTRETYRHVHPPHS